MRTVIASESQRGRSKRDTTITRRSLREELSERGVRMAAQRRLLVTIIQDSPKHLVIVNPETQEKTGELAPGVKYNFWMYDGHVPGPFIRVRVGDIPEVHLKNLSLDKAEELMGALVPVRTGIRIRESWPGSDLSMAGGTIRRKRIRRESFRASVLHPSETERCFKALTRRGVA
jgi:hypothetical protein